MKKAHVSNSGFGLLAALLAALALPVSVQAAENGSDRVQGVVDNDTANGGWVSRHWDFSKSPEAASDPMYQPAAMGAQGPVRMDLADANVDAYRDIDSESYSTSPDGDRQDALNADMKW